MDPLSQIRFDSITNKEVEALTDGEISFLKSRASYLTETQERVYAKILKRKPEVVNEPNLNKSRSYRALQAQGKELGLKYVGVSREDLERSIDTAVGPK